jgi:uncharacterized protein DUF6152
MPNPRSYDDGKETAMTPPARLVAALIMSIGLSGVLAAHHSFDAEYDSNKPITITGVVTKVDWANPHAFVYLDSKAASGDVKRYKIEMGPPYALVRGGWKRDTLKIGDTVTVENAALAKDGSDSAGSMPTTQMRLSSGQKLTMR